MTTNHRTGQAQKFIPPPPDPDEEGYDALIAYFHKYTTEELEKAGHLQEPSRKEVESMEASATYSLLCEKGVHVQLPRKDYERLT